MGSTNQHFAPTEMTSNTLTVSEIYDRICATGTQATLVAIRVICVGDEIPRRLKNLLHLCTTGYRVALSETPTAMIAIDGITYPMSVLDDLNRIL